MTGRCASVAERWLVSVAEPSRSAEASRTFFFTENPAFRLSLNDRDFSRPVAEHRLLSVGW